MLQVFKRKTVPVEEFLEHKRKKKWLEKGAKKYCLYIYPRSLYITWGHMQQYWDWKCFKETCEENIEVAKLATVCWVDVQGALPLSDLEEGTTYEVAFVIKLTKGATGWELPVEVKLRLPNQAERIRRVSLLDKPRGEWFEVSLGKFEAKDVNGGGEVRFDMYEHGGHWKIGLIIKGVIFRPTEEEPQPHKAKECCACFNLKAAAAAAHEN